MAKTSNTVPKVRKNDNCAYIMILPAYLVFTIFILVPIGIVIYYSVTNFNLYSAPEFVGMKNYLTMFRDADFLISIVSGTYAGSDAVQKIKADSHIQDSFLST